MKKKAQEWFHTTFTSFFHFDFYISRLEYAIYIGTNIYDGQRERERWCGSCIAEEELIGSDLGYVSRVAATVHTVK